LALAAAGAALVLAWGWLAPPTGAQLPAQQAPFAHVQVISYASGLTGFFDQKDGSLYLYDGNAERCVFIRKMTKLGDPMQKVRDP
jgi:hypothetical protein